MGSELGSYSQGCEGSRCCKQQEEAQKCMGMHGNAWECMYISAALAAKPCGEELLFARLRTLDKVSPVQTMIKSLSCGGEIPPNKFFPVVRYLFLFLADIRTL